MSFEGGPLLMYEGGIVDLERYKLVFTFEGPVIGPHLQDRDTGYILESPSRLWALRLRDGTDAWRADLPGPCGRLLDAGETIACVHEGGVSLVRKADGDVRPLVEVESPIHDEALLPGALALAHRDGTVSIVSLAAGEVLARVAPPQDLQCKDDPGLAASLRHGVVLACWACNDGEAGFYALSGLDMHGRQRWSRRFRVAAPGGSPATPNEWLVPRPPLLDGHVLFTTRNAQLSLYTVLVRIADGSAFEGSVETAAVVELPDGEVDGLFVRRSYDAPFMYLDPRSAEARWWPGDPCTGSTTGAAAVRDGDRLIVALCETRSCTFGIECRTLSTGAPCWRGDVVPIDVGHGRYWQEVSLALRGDDVILISQQMFSVTLQAFDRETGARRFADMRLTGVRR